jgi:hypothetical protein
MFARRRKTKQFCEPRFVRLAGRTIAVRLDPFWMLHAQSVVNLLLKLTVRADFVRSSWRHVHSHPQSYRRRSHRRDFVRRIFQYHSRGDPYSLVRGRREALINIPQRHRRGSSIAIARPVALTQSRDVRSGARACSRGGSVNCRNTR